MALSKDVVIRLLGDATSAQNAMKAAADAAEVSVGAYRRAEREMRKQEAAAAALHRRQREMMDEVGRGAMVAGAAILAGFAIAVKQAAEFEKAMSAVSAATNATARQQERLRDAALEAGASTQYSATEAAEAETELAKAGVSVANILSGGLKGSLDLAAAGQLAVADAAGIAATQMKVFGLSGQATGHVADLLAAGAGKAMGSVEDLAGALKYVGPVAAGMGVSIEESTGALALLASQGILGEQAGTSLRGVISSLASPSKQAAATLDDLGISVFDAQGNFVGLASVAGQMHDKLGGLTEAERSAALGRIFGNEQLTAARVLYSAGAEGVQQWTEAVNDSGFAQEQAAKLTDNLVGDVERLGGALSTVLITGGTGSNAVLREMVQGVSAAVDAYSALPDPVEGAITGFAGVVGAGTLLLGTVATMSVRIGEFRDRLQAMGPAGEKASRAIGRIGSAVGKVAIVGGMAVAIWELGQAAANAAIDMFDLDDGASDVADALADIDAGAVTKSLRDLATEGHAIGWLADTFGNVNRAVAEMMDNLTRGDRSVEFRAHMEALDNSLTELANGGEIETATEAFARLGREWIAQGGSADELLMYFPQFGTALQQYAAGQQRGESSTAGLTGATQDQITAIDQATTSVDDLKNALEGLNGSTKDQFDAEAQWTESLGRLRDQFEQGTGALDRNTEAGAANWDLISRSVGSAEDLALAIYNTTGSYDEFKGSLQRSRESLVKTLIDMGVAEDKAWALTDSILQIPPQAPTTATMNTDPARRGRDDVLGMIRALNITPATVNVYVKPSTADFFNTMNQITTGTYQAQVGVRYVTGPRPQWELLGDLFGGPRAGGGDVRPGKTYLVGEEGPELLQVGASGYVTPAGLTAQAIGEARAAGAAGTPVAVGPGIPVGSSGPAAAAAAAAIDYERLAAAVAAGRAMVHVDHLEVPERRSVYELAEDLTWIATTRGTGSG